MQSELESRLLKLERRIRADGADLAGAKASARQVRSSTIALGAWMFSPPVPTVDTPCCSSVPLTLYLKRRQGALPPTYFTLTCTPPTGGADPEWVGSGGGRSYTFECYGFLNQWQLIEDDGEDTTLTTWNPGQYTCPASCPEKASSSPTIFHTVGPTPFV